MYEMSYIASQMFVAFFLIVYSALFIALVWGALSARLSPAVKNGMATAMVRAIRRLAHSRRSKIVVASLSVMLFSALIFGVISAFAQEPKPGPLEPVGASIEGAITLAVQQGESLPVPGVFVKLASASLGSESLSTTTDGDGRYQFTKLGPGFYMMEASLQGFRTFTGSILLKQGEAAVKNVSLELDRVVQQVEVQDKAPTESTQGTDSTATVSSRQFTTLPLAEQKFKAALPLIPGVVRTRDGKLNFKGSVENQGMLLVDSARTVDPVTGSFSIPIPVDAIQTLNVYKTPYSAEYGGFSGGLTTIETKPPSSRRDFGLMDFIPGVRGKNGQIVGISDWTPRLFFGGPILKNKLNFSEAFTYEVRKSPVRGLAWPHNERKGQGFNTLTSIQAILSPQHLLSVEVNGFSNRNQFADIKALVPQPASSDDGQRGASIGVIDSYQFSSGALLSTVFRYTRFDSNAHGQGPDDMLITPEGWGGNFFNARTRTANQFELLPMYRLPQKQLLGRHELKLGVDFIHRSYDEGSLSHPIQLLRQDSSLAERIDFVGGGSLKARDTEVAEFVQDHWMLNNRLAVDLGSRLSSQSIGRSAAFAPRAGIVYSPGEDRKTIIRAGAGLFYDRVPLLAADFVDNPTRVVTFYDESGIPTGSPITFQNAYARSVSGLGLVRTGRNLDTSARNFTWNFEVDREIWRSTVLRVSYLYSQTHDLYVVTPVAGTSGGASLLGLTNTGGSHYHELEATLHYRASERSELNVSYIRSRARGNLNTLADIFVPFEQPVIRPDGTSNVASDIPNRVVSWGAFSLPWNLTLSPVVDLHSGLPYSKVDTFHDYVGAPNSQRFPAFFSLDLKVYREFKINMPFIGRMKNQKFRFGLYTINLTNHSNPRDVYNNVASPFFGHFVGFQHRVNGFVIDVVN